MPKKIIFYYQTLTSLKPILFEDTPVTHIHLSAIHFGVDKSNEPYIHLNNNNPYNYIFDNLWLELEKATELGIKIILMIGGAGGAYKHLFYNFNTYYNMLRILIKSKPCIVGVDIDVEEYCSLDNIKLLIRQLTNDFGENFIISTAPIQSSIENDTPGLAGFVYKDLINSDEGKYIDYINGQFYVSYTLSAYDNVINNSYDSTKVVMGMTSGEDISELPNIVKKYGDKFGGVFIWEYFSTKPTPLEWLNNMNKLLNSGNETDYEISDELTEDIKITITEIIKETFKNLENNPRCTII